MTRIDIAADYATARRAAYPDVGEQLDALNKLVAAFLQQQTPPADAVAVVQKVQRVKAAYPKPPDGERK